MQIKGAATPIAINPKQEVPGEEKYKFNQVG
jgi:hypothetical protein